MWLAWPPVNYTAPLLLIGLVPLLVALSAIKEDDRLKKGKRIFLTAGLSFLVWNTVCIYWVYNSIHSFNDAFTSLLISLIPYGLGALLMTFAFWLYYRLSIYTSKWIAYLGLVSFWIAMEYLHQSWDLAFPWMNLGNGFAKMHQLIQWYEYTGVYGGTLWVLVSNIIGFEAYRSYKTKNGLERYKLSIVLSVVIVIPITLSLSKYTSYEEKSVPVNVVVVQPNIDPYLKYGSISAYEQVSTLTRLSDSIGQTNTEYFIWPETAIPNFANEYGIRTNMDYMRIQEFLSKYKNGTVISGIESVKTYPTAETVSAKFDANSNQYYDNFNAAVQIENSADVQFYHKSKLVPGVEKMPFPTALAFLKPVFAELGGSVGGWGWQDHPAVFYSYGGVGVTPVICYESIWGEWVGKAVKDGAQFIAIITNDGWWGNTSGKDQHFLYAKLRAIETRRWIARSANTGISGFIDQKGDIVSQSAWWTRTALKAEINLNSDLTFYVKNGDLIARFFCITAILLALIIPYRKWIRKLR
ncbi:apolipoprotein N-acyltransferase [Pedobacter metabolipauper]